MWLRWVASAIWQPRFCIHSFNTDGTVNEPWMNDSVREVRQMLRWRTRLRPTLYAALFRTCEGDGTPAIRPLPIRRALPVAPCRSAQIVSIRPHGWTEPAMATTT